jgi:tetratricopeptide (TPR) repeat protein
VILLVLGLGGVLVAVRGRGHSDPRELAAATRLALKNRQWSRAESLLTQLAQHRTPTADDVGLRAELELGRSRVDQAVSLLTGIPETDPHAAQARLLAGRTERSRDRARRMESLFLEALRLNPKLAWAHRELILLYAMQARRAELNAQYRALSALEPLAYEDVLFWTASLEDIWINETIRDQLERFLAADPDDRFSRLALAGVLLRSNQLEEAGVLLRCLPDSDFDAQVLRARIALNRMRLEEVRSLLDKGPVEHSGLALLRGQLAVRMNDPSTADRQFRIALRQDPSNREALQGLSIVLQKLGQAESAAGYRKQAEHWSRLTALLEKARDPAPSRRDPDLIRQLAEACEHVGQLAEARAWYQLALGLNPLDQRVQQALYRLRDQAASGEPASGSSSGEELKAETAVSSP